MSNTDIRVQVTFPGHWKTRKLESLVGHEGVKCLIYLWIFTAANKSNGLLTDMNDNDIEVAAYWTGEKGEFVRALVETKLLDGESEFRSIHDWKEHQPWAANAEKRTKAARKAGKASGTARQRKVNGKGTEGERKVNGSGTPSPLLSLPSPLPFPTDSAKADGCDKFVAKWIDLCKELREIDYHPTKQDIGQIRNCFNHLKGDLEEWDKTARNYLESEYVKMPTPGKLYAGIEPYRAQERLAGGDIDF